MSVILTYRPQYEYKQKLEAVLRDSSEPELVSDPLGHGPDAHGGELSPSEQLIQDGKEKGYEPSTPILDYVDVTPTDVLQGYLEAKAELQGLEKKIIEILKDKVTIGPSISEYIEARSPGENQNLDVAYEFEDAHSDSIDGSTAAEPLPVIQDFLNELDSLVDFIDAHIGPIQSILASEETIEDDELVNPELEREREKEAAEIAHMIKLDRERRLDVGRANERNHLLGFLDNRFRSLKEFAQEVDVLISDNVSSAYGGAARQIVDTLIAAPSLAPQFRKTNQERFDVHARNSADAHARMRRLITHTYKVRLLTEVVEKQQEKLSARQYVEQIEQINPAEEGDPFNLFLMDALDSIQATCDDCDQLVEDLYRINELEHIQNVDYLQSLRQKNEARQVHRLIGQALSIDWSQANSETELTRILSQ